MSAVWGLGFAGLCGFNLDPLGLVVPVLITARALSHSVQSMERYHEEYFRCGNKDEAITKSYTELFPPAMVAIASDGLAIFTIAVASIPIMQKLAFVASFWIISIFLSVVTLHPIILSYVRPPDHEPNPRRSLANRVGIGAGILALACGAALDEPIERMHAFAALSKYMEITTVAALVATALVGLFFVTAGLTLRALEAADDAVITKGLRATRLAGWGLAILASGWIVRSGVVDVAWFLEPWVVGSAAAVAVGWIVFWRSGASANGIYDSLCQGLIWLSRGSLRYAVLLGTVVLLGGGYYYAHKLKVGDTTPGAALLYQSHPYNVAFDKVNEKFVGASQLVIIAEGKEPEAIKRASTLHHLDLFGRYMEQAEGTGGALTATTLLKKVFRTFHEGDPKWEILPTSDDHVGQLFFLLTSSTRRGEMDRFFDIQYTNATIAVFYRDYNNKIIHDSIARAKRYISEYTTAEEPVTYRLAGGLLGILAAVNEEVEWSYNVNISLILLVVLVLSAATYWGARGALALLALGGGAFVWWQIAWVTSVTEGWPVVSWVLAPIQTLHAIAPQANVMLVAFVAFMIWHWHSVLGALIVMAPSLVAQPLSEGVMYLTGIDFNINSLPVAAVGIGIGIDYGYYVLSRIGEEYTVDHDYDEANRRALLTTGKAVLFTGSTLVASVVFWLFFPMKFQAQMAMLLAMLLAFHVVGALVVIPAMVSVLKPRFEFGVPEQVPAVAPAAAPQAMRG
jgi:predicted RND superfamily exporter protein